MVNEKTGKDGGAQNKDLGGDGFEDANGGKSDDGNGANLDLPKDPGNGNLTNPGGNQTGNQYTQRSSGTEGSKRILHEVSVLKGEEIFSLLLQRGAIGSTDQFQWCEKVSKEVLQEVESFWQDEEQSFAQNMQLSVEDDQEVQLPEDLFTSKEEEAISVEGEGMEAEKGKKQKTWGPVMATRQSNRVDRSMKIMDKAKELKKKINLEMLASKKLSGIMKSNPFNLLQFDSLGDMASTVGVKIGSSILDSVLDDSEMVRIPTSVDLSCLVDNKNIGWEVKSFSVGVIVKNRCNDYIFRIVTVYGSPYEEGKQAFISELHELFLNWQGPIIIGGDFNLVRAQSDKSNGNVDFRRVDRFNAWVDMWSLIEIGLTGRSFTWSNNQENRIMSKIDRIFVSTEFEALFPLASARALPRIGSDHTPIVWDAGIGNPPKKSSFKFEKWWLSIPDFKDIVIKAWFVNGRGMSSLE
jgi:hypothetical protein